MSELVRCEICKESINSEKGITLLENKSYHPNCFNKRNANKDSQTYLMTERNAMPLLHSFDFYIWGIKNTQNLKEKKRTDILLINKETKKEFLIYNWKRVFSDKPKNCHYWHYEVYSDGELITDGEYIVKDERKARQSDLINYLFEILELRKYKKRR